MIVGQFHGILTGQSDPTWPDYGTEFFAGISPSIHTINSEYFALPLPRIEALRNRGRSRALADDIEFCGSFLRLEHDSPAISLVAHSNGGVLALQVARDLIKRGFTIRSLVLIAPALRTGPATREIADWIEFGFLDYALLVRPTRDLLIGAIGKNWRTKLFSWPWGSLGYDGWSAADLPSLNFGMETIDLQDMGHGDPVAPANRQWLYEAIIAPALGLAPWGDLSPKGGIEE